MTLLGLFCLAMVALSLTHRAARPFGLLILTHWAATKLTYYAAGDVVYALLIPRDVVVGAVAVWLISREPTQWRVIITVCYACMSALHVLHWIYYAQGVYVGVQYMAYLNGLFVAQLLALGVGANGLGLVRRWRLRLLDPHGRHRRRVEA